MAVEYPEASTSAAIIILPSAKWNPPALRICTGAFCPRKKYSEGTAFLSSSLLSTCFDACWQRADAAKTNINNNGVTERESLIAIASSYENQRNQSEL